MKNLFACVAVVLLCGGLITAAGQVVGTVSNLDSGKKEVTVNVKTGIELKIGDELEVTVNGKKIILEVKYPMQTVAICKIKGKGKLADLMNGLSVYRYSKDKPADAPRAGDTKFIGNMEFVYVEGGTFKMGSPWPEGDDIERPDHEITVDGFWMGKYEVTQKQYEEIIEENPSKYKKASLPVTNIRWKDAENFCNEFSAKYNIKARLPYEAEWEYACRAGSTTRYYWGDKMSSEFCWNRHNSDGKPHPGGKKKPNAFGLYDMSGNVNEWVFDWYDEEFYSKSPVKNPCSTKKGSGFRMLRGGSYYSFPDSYLRSAYRGRGLVHSDIKGVPGDGFRVVVVE